MSTSPKTKLALSALGLHLALSEGILSAGDRQMLESRARRANPLSLEELQKTHIDKTNPAVAELYDFVTTLNIIVQMEERSDKKVKRVNGIIRDYCKAKIKEAKHEGTQRVLRNIAAPILCRQELTKAVRALAAAEMMASKITGYKADI